MKIKKITANSSASDSELRIGDDITEINQHPIRDFIDFQYYTSEENLSIKYRRDNQFHFCEIERKWNIPLGIEPQEHECRTCANECIFCFVDQVKPGLRDGLNLKDDDYLFSFVFGNFITLTNLAQRDFDRIVEQHLSPLYVSVHTTNSLLHKKMIRYKHDFDIMSRLSFLAENGIDLHTQIVVVPDWNDAKELEKSLRDLVKLEVLSIGIVPVGLTKFRTKLLPLEKVDQEKAKEIISICEKVSNDLQTEIIYCSDELFITAKQEIPEEKYYDDYPQLENGIGMIRLLLENWEDNKSKFIADMQKLESNLIFITAVSPSSYIKEIANEVKENLADFTVKTQIVKNKFFGEDVTVAGLLTAEDIFAQANQNDAILVVPASIFNYADFTLDDVTKDDFISKAKNRIVFVEEEFSDWEIFFSDT